MVFSVVYEDDYFVAVDKPSGVVCRFEAFPDFLLIHRLDKETSGLLLLAKNESALAAFQSLFRNREVKKTYLGVFSGRVLSPHRYSRALLDNGFDLTEISRRRGRITGPLRRIPSASEKFGVGLGGRPARTDFKVLNYYSYNSFIFSFVEMQPHTGRTHQIRVHFATAGWPLVGDHLYGRGDSSFLNVRRQLLHAKSLAFRHPFSGQALKLETGLPDDFKSFLKRLKKVRESRRNEKNTPSSTFS